ncbi:hypothetical protein [Rhodoferax sp. UBA5149]|uniref:hypothetical protein n=1 Tax=Rhodoferax sp. UBA5149 TaxID=1947379 RepID=UPI0025EBD9DD|nr:hypothetical protein [Rhodoferax sp. UBA5149]
MNPKIESTSCQRGIGILLVVLVGLLSACNPNYRGHDKPILHTTISADGKMVATLLNAGTDKQLLRVRNLGTDTTWRTVQGPPLTHSIRFGLQGHELLLTHRKPDLPAKDYLSKLDLDNPERGLQKIYESEDGLAFPVEVTPGQVMVRTRHADQTGKRFYLSGYYWILVGQDQQLRKVGPDPVLPYAAPNIVGSGFFWTEDQMGEKKEAHPLVLSYPLPGGVAPIFSRERLEKNTHDVLCDRMAKRCLRWFISNLNQIPHGSYIYDVDVLFGATSCKLPGLSGRPAGVSLTPDGNAAVMSLAAGPDKPRHVVVMHFNPQQCEAISLQHINFEEK